MVHKTWNVTDEKELVDEFKRLGCKRFAIPVLAKRFDRSPDAILKKLERLGLNVVGAKFQISTTTIDPVKVLPSLEQVLKILAGALQKATEAGLGKTEIQRLDTIATLYKAYESGLEKYVNYKLIEQELVRLREKFDELVKKEENDAAKRDSATVVQPSAQ